ncbi:hypothetical protein J6590_100931, partial [Homalodisca vitripennis]
MRCVLKRIPETGYYTYSDSEEVPHPSEVKPNSIMVFDDEHSNSEITLHDTTEEDFDPSQPLGHQEEVEHTDMQYDQEHAGMAHSPEDSPVAKRKKTNPVIVLIQVLQALPFLQEDDRIRETDVRVYETSVPTRFDSRPGLQDATARCTTAEFCEWAITSDPRKILVHDIVECRDEEEAHILAQRIQFSRRGPNVNTDSRRRGFTILSFHAATSSTIADGRSIPAAVRHSEDSSEEDIPDSLSAEGFRLLTQHALEDQRSPVLAEVSGKSWKIRGETRYLPVKGRRAAGYPGLVETRHHAGLCAGQGRTTSCDEGGYKTASRNLVGNVGERARRRGRVKPEEIIALMTTLVFSPPETLLSSSEWYRDSRFKTVNRTGIVITNCMHEIMDKINCT